MSQEIETTVDALIASYGVAYTALYMGVKKNALGGNTEMDRWSVAFTKGDGREAFEEFAFYTGMGLREKVTGLKAMRMQNPTMHKGQWQATKPQAPNAAMVLHSLILDMSADCTSFRNWCDEFGYDNDSISARNTYDACQENAYKLKRIFSFEQLDKLAEALQDY